MPLKFIKVPEDFQCAISHEIMIDPVFTADGHTYERANIKAWLANHDTSPNDNQKLEHKGLTPNRGLKSQISQFVEDNRKTFEKELIEAAKTGDSETVLLVLQLGISVNAQDEQGWTALHHAASQGKISVVKLLVDNKAKFDLATAKIVNAKLQTYFEIIKKNTQVKLHHGKPELLDERLRIAFTAKMLVREIHAAYAYATGQRYLAQINILDKLAEIRSTLYESYKSDLITAMRESITVYHPARAITEFLPDIVAVLMHTHSSDAAGVEINACLEDLRKVIKDFAQATAAPYDSKRSYNSSDGSYPYSYSFGPSYNRTTISFEEGWKYEEELKRQMRELAKHYAVRLQELEATYATLVTDSALKFSSLVNSNGCCHAVHLAIMHGHSAVAKFLMSKDPAMATLVDGNGWTLLHWAVSYGDSELCKELFAITGLNIDAQDRDGNTALHLAAVLASDPSILTLCLQAGANPEIKNNQNQTPVELALACKNQVNADFIPKEAKRLERLKIKTMEETIRALQEQVRKLTLVSSQHKSSTTTTTVSNNNVVGEAAALSSYGAITAIGGFSSSTSEATALPSSDAKRISDDALGDDVTGENLKSHKTK